jgi:hypothetical protein
MIETLNSSQILSYLYHDFARSEEKIVCLQLFAHLGCKLSSKMISTLERCCQIAAYNRSWKCPCANSRCS